MPRPLHIGMIAGEASGDALGEALIRELAQDHPGLRVSGVGGPRMIAAGMESLHEMERLSVMGFVEPLKRLPELLRMRRQLIRHFSRERVDLFVGIDSPDFNLGIARALHERGIRTAQYVSPSVWAWRQGRVKGIRRAIDLMLTLFPFESDFYRREGVPVRFVGHPLAQQLATPLTQNECRRQLGLETNGPVLTLMPGSRRGEVELMWPIFLQTARLLRQHIPTLQVLVPAANKRLYEFLAPHREERMQLQLGQAQAAIGAADAVLVASGTSTLEVMLLDRPMVVAYRLGWLTYQIARHLVHTPHIALPNLLAGERLVPEFIQDEADPARLAKSLEPLLLGQPEARQQRQAFASLRSQLQGESARRAADALATLLPPQKS